MDYDKIIVIGGGPSGSSVASFLSMKGHNVTLFEKEKFPRPHVGESLLPFNYALFDELGVLNDMEVGFQRKPGVRFSNSDGKRSTVWYFEDVIKDPSSLSFHVERASFDKLLLDRSRELGTLVFEETAVKKVDFEIPDGVRVVTLDKEGNTKEHFANFVIDASGQSTFLANKFRDKSHYDGLDRVAVNSHWTNPTYHKELKEGCVEIIHLGGEKMGWIWAIPLSDTRVSVGVVMSADYFKSQRKKFAGDKNILDIVYHQELAGSSLISDVLKTATKEAPAMAHGDYSYYTDKKFGKKFAVIGDASAFLDPIFSSGIYVGMMSAKLVSEKLDIAITQNKCPMAELEPVYDTLKGGYDLIEKLIRLFYDPNAISLSNLSDVQNEDYDKFYKAYKIYHFLLQGDFLRNYKKYMKAADLLKDTKNLEKYTNLVNKKDSVAVFKP
jgi:flavin-dependent dehydrogenase